MCYNIEYEPADIIIHVQGKGIVLREKSLIAFQESDGKILAFGTEAEQLAGKDTDNIVVMSPLRQGRVEDFTVAQSLFYLLLIKALGKKPFGKKLIFKPAIAVCVPKGITPVEKKVIEDVMIYNVASKVLISDIPAEKFIREFPEKYPKEYEKYKITIGITKDEPERYVEERLRDILAYAGQEQISQERVSELFQRIKERYESNRSS